MAADPFAGLVSRALGIEVEHVEAEPVRREDEIAGAETQRVRWRARGDSGSLLFRRYPTKGATEAALLPLLARRGAPVPRVLASGVPPRHAAEARPWLLMSDPGDAPAARDERAAGLAAARAAVSRDTTTLVSLGVPTLAPSRIRDEALWAEELLDETDFSRVRRLADAVDAEGLAAGGTTLVHGALDGNAVRGDGRVILVGWSRAHLGAAAVDDPADRASDGALAALFAIRWYAWEAREMLRPGPRAAALVRQVLDRYN